MFVTGKLKVVQKKDMPLAKSKARKALDNHKSRKNKKAKYDNVYV